VNSKNIKKREPVWMKNGGGIPHPQRFIPARRVPKPRLMYG